MIDAAEIKERPLVQEFEEGNAEADDDQRVQLLRELFPNAGQPGFSREGAAGAGPRPAPIFSAQVPCRASLLVYVNHRRLRGSIMLKRTVHVREVPPR